MERWMYINDAFANQLINFWLKSAVVEKLCALFGVVRWWYPHPVALAHFWGCLGTDANNGDGPDNTYWMSQAQITHRYPSAPFDALMKEFATNERKDWGPRVESDAGDAAHELLRLENAMPFEYVKLYFVYE